MPVKQPRFLARQNYRRRRMADAARLLPLLGLFLFLLPILWRPATSPEPDTASGGVYLFSVWLVLIAAAYLLARRLSTDVPRNGSGTDGSR